MIKDVNSDDDITLTPYLSISFSFRQQIKTSPEVTVKFGDDGNEESCSIMYV